MISGPTITVAHLVAHELNLLRERQSDCSFQHREPMFVVEQCCEKGTRERKLGPPRYWWTDTAAETQLKNS